MLPAPLVLGDNDEAWTQRFEFARKARLRIPAGSAVVKVWLEQWASATLAHLSHRIVCPDGSLGLSGLHWDEERLWGWVKATPSWESDSTFTLVCCVEGDDNGTVLSTQWDILLTDMAADLHAAIKSHWKGVMPVWTVGGTYSRPYVERVTFFVDTTIDYFLEGLVEASRPYRRTSKLQGDGYGRDRWRQLQPPKLSRPYIILGTVLMVELNADDEDPGTIAHLIESDPATGWRRAWFHEGDAIQFYLTYVRADRLSVTASLVSPWAYYEFPLMLYAISRAYPESAPEIRRYLGRVWAEDEQDVDAWFRRYHHVIVDLDPAELMPPAAGPSSGPNDGVTDALVPDHAVPWGKMTQTQADLVKKLRAGLTVKESAAELGWQEEPLRVVEAQLRREFGPGIVPYRANARARRKNT